MVPAAARGLVVASVKGGDSVTVSNRHDNNGSSTSAGLTLQDSGSGNSTLTPVSADTVASPDKSV